jgi:hypothetical protein
LENAKGESGKESARVTKRKGNLHGKGRKDGKGKYKGKGYGSTDLRLYTSRKQKIETIGFIHS